MKKSIGFIRGFIDTIPMGISSSIFGLVYGVLGGKAGLSTIEVIAMSLIVFAGSSQIAAVQMIALGSSPLSIIVTVFIINLRHSLMAASISPYLKEVSTKLKMISAYFMTDEGYAVTYSHFQKNKPSIGYFLGTGICMYSFWGVSGAAGCLFGSALPASVNYIFDFAFVAAFIGMLVPMIKDFPMIVTVVASGVISVLGALMLPGKWYIIIAGLAASLAGYMTSRMSGADKASAVLKKEEVSGNEE